MAFDFPPSPTVGTISNGYTWDGEKWLLVSDTPNQGGVIAIKVFTANGTYTPSANMTTCVIECVGGGGGGGGVQATGVSINAVGAGGGGGACARSTLTAAQVGASLPIVIGVGGAGGVGALSGSLGGTTTVGSLLSASGGLGGTRGDAYGVTVATLGGAGGAATLGDVGIPGSHGSNGFGQPGAALTSGGGGASGYGSGGAAGGFNNNGISATGFGGGGGGASSGPSSPARNGGNGATGVVIITEYGITALSPSSSASGNVRYDVAQGLTAPQQEQARSNIFAAPFDVIAYSGLQINGDFSVLQWAPAGMGFAVTGNIMDQWRGYRSGTAQGYYFQYGGAPSSFGTHYLAASTTVAEPTLNAASYYMVYQAIEGQRMMHMLWGTPYAQPITLAFWSAHNRTGIYTGVVKHPGGLYSYAFSYNQLTADIGQYNVITIPGPTMGTWPITQDAGMLVMFCIACGANNLAPSFNSWLAGNYIGGVGQVNGVGSTSDYFRLGHVLVLPGTQAPTRERSSFIVRPFDQELTLCQRFYRQSYLYGVVPGTITQGGQIQVFAHATSNYINLMQINHDPMRTAPVVKVYSPATGAVDKFRNNDLSADVAAQVSSGSPRGFWGFVYNTAVGMSQGITGHYVEDARLT